MQVCSRAVTGSRLLPSSPEACAYLQVQQEWRLSVTDQNLCSALAVTCSLLACITDVRKKVIPNALTLSSAILGLSLHYAAGGWRGLTSSLTAGLLAGILFAILYVIGGMGAGDVKLIAAIGFLNGMPSMGLLLVVTVVSGGVFGLMMAIRSGRLRQTTANIFRLAAHHAQNGLQPHEGLNLSNESTLRIPYAVPIAVGCIAAACATLRVNGL